jgi:hypothetical protein
MKNEILSLILLCFSKKQFEGFFIFFLILSSNIEYTRYWTL